MKIDWKTTYQRQIIVIDYTPFYEILSKIHCPSYQTIKFLNIEIFNTLYHMIFIFLKQLQVRKRDPGKKTHIMLEVFVVFFDYIFVDVC